ncbi:MAG: HAD-IC family P-type ATPase, partial [Anaerolineales bacterium]
LKQDFSNRYQHDLDSDHILQVEEVAGYGVKAKLNGGMIRVGNDAFMHRENIPHTDCDVPGTVVHLAIDQQYHGYIVVTDEIKPEAREAVDALHHLGIRKVMMFSGDQEDVAARVSRQVGVDEYRAGLLPQDKVDQMEAILENKTEGRVAFVGDGINDAPALARSDVGIAMGAFGTDAAKETADVVLMTDSVLRVPDAVRLGRRTRRIVWQNIALALGVKALFIALGVAGEASMWEAVFADVGVTVLAVLNATRVLR